MIVLIDNNLMSVHRAQKKPITSWLSDFFQHLGVPLLQDLSDVFTDLNTMFGCFFIQFGPHRRWHSDGHVLHILAVTWSLMVF